MVLFGLAGCTVFDGLTVPVEDAGAPSAYLPLDRAVAACSLVFRCPSLSEALSRSIGVPASDASFSACVTWFGGPIPPNRFGFEVQAGMLDCVGAAPGCAEALACAFVEPLSPGDARCAGASGDVCPSDDLLLGCVGGQVERCTSAHFGPGSECRLGLGGKGRCALAGCLPETAAPPRCSAGVHVFCDAESNLRVAKRCTAVGLTCVEGAEGALAQCATADGIFPCDKPGVSVCAPDGQRARVCDGALSSEFDCAALGGLCVEEAAGARCARSDEICSPLDGWVDECAGSTLALCVSGKPTSFDCAALGLSCKPADGVRSGYCG